MSRPNILLVMADQLAPHFTSTYGHPVVSTPHLDALAARGTRFDAMYCHSPLCAPARFTMLAGRSVSAIGAWDNAAEFPASAPTIAHHLQAAGHRTILTGKMHFVGPDQMHGFEERLTTDIYPADFAWTPDWDAPRERFDKWFHNMDPLREAGPAVTTHQIDYDEEVGYTARRKLHDLARDGDERPFLLVASFINPHDPYVARPEWWDRYDDDAIDLPDPVDESALDAHSLRVRAGIQADTVGFTEGQTRAARRGYYANTSYVDDWLGRLVATLEETGLADDTVVMVTADHGDHLGDRGLWYKMTFYERSLRVPLVMAGPGVANRTVPNVASHLDILPTVLDAATDGGPWREQAHDLEGRSLWPLASGDDDEISEATAEYAAEMTSHPMFMIRRDNLKYIHCDTDPPLLYDLDVDPLERTNLAAHEDHSHAAAAFAEEVAARWDSDAIRERVLASQRARHTVHRAMDHTAGLHSWDHLPANDVANHYVRNHQDVVEASLRSRLEVSRKRP
ncbi:MAG: choline-sulfatase [Acidimicrobiales bacterium]|nr:MAG: choline-sulfatase [Acidimicrobiales bacterium]